MKQRFFAKLDTIVAEAKRLRISGFGDQEPEEATKQLLLEPLLHALGFASESNYVREYKILGDSVDYLLKSERPLIFVEAKSLHDCPKTSLLDKHRQQVLRYLQNYRLSPEIARMEHPVKWILLTNLAQFHFIRLNEVAPSFSFSLEDLCARREQFWELLALDNLAADRIDELYDQQLKPGLDQQFLLDLKKWRSLLANGFAFRNQARSLDAITLASQQLLDRFIFCRMLETHRLLDYNKLARTFAHYDALYARADKTFAEVLRDTLFREIKNDFNTELFTVPLLCDELDMDNIVLAAVVGHAPLAPDLAAQCGFDSEAGELPSFRHLYSYDFSRMSQDVLGAVYERFLAHKLLPDRGRIVIEDTDELRKKEGVYYTPQYIVDYIVEQTLGQKIRPILVEARSLLGYKNYQGAHARVRELQHIKVLDPAMGSGSFLLRAFDALVRAYDEYNRECRRHKKERNSGGTLFDADFVVAEEVLDVPRHVLAENIFGVDLDAQAVEMAKLSLWLRYMALSRDRFLDRLRRRRRGDKPLNLLPNLQNNLRRGNSLISDPAVAGDAAFDWEKEFPQVMQRGGFDVVIGNPPYRMLQPHNTGEDVLSYLRQHFAGVEFKIDLFHLFLQRDVSLLRQGGAVGHIVPTSILNNVYAAGLRRWLAERCCVEHISVCGEQVFPDADVHTTILTLRREESDKARAGHEVLATSQFDESSPRAGLTYSRIGQSSFLQTPGCVWNILLNEENADLIGRLQTQFTPLKALARINRGLVTGDRRRFIAETKKTDSHVPIIEGEDVLRYYAAPPSHFVLFERPETAGGCWEPEVHLAPHKIVIRQIGHGPTATVLRRPVAVTANLFTIRAPTLEDELYLLGILNSRLTAFFWRTMFADFKTSFPQVTAFSLEQLPVKWPQETNKALFRIRNELIARVSRMLDCRLQFYHLTPALRHAVRHSDRTPCNLAHYLQKDFAAALQGEILLDDVQREGFVHSIRLDPAGKQITLQAEVAPNAQSQPQLTPVLRLEFEDESLRQFVYACWRQFLEDHSRQKKWTKGRKPEPIYPLLANRLEPLVYFSPRADDNLRAIRDLMAAVAREAGSADLAAVEAEIARLDREIDERVYELYGLTPEEKAMVKDEA